MSGISIKKGSLYGTGVFVLFHELILPLTKTIPTPKDQPFEEHFSELLSYIVWLYTIDHILKSEMK
ncbi:DUF1440 domain-containing protein [Macrococcoides canis]|uniref:DUF1440 domain-containing protein n=1 Tax=Macrococcoides canis TaxID=1855823 RepID=UPI001AEBAB7A|nr:DUF1440 domain-containing protein [Macrococcus canis]QTQ08169.1 DUF1440 domain-containing protein [Macrococcus canis]UTH00155.1 DUF1440 domain-containing protein [Macrococcus canis]UTH06910.1 DUF1440 domain-containing protein [Macrococcus canis]